MSPEAQIALYTLIAGAFAALVTAGNYLVRGLYERPKQRIRELEAKLKEYEEKGTTPDAVLVMNEQLARLQEKYNGQIRATSDLSITCSQKEAEIVRLRKEVGALEAVRDALATDNTSLQGRLGEAASERGRLARDLARSAEQHDAHAKEGRSWQRVIRTTLKAEGRVWVQKVPGSAPQPAPLAERKTPVISLLNLKGGVGKTTLTAFLGLAMARRGWKVLYVDLDLQGSLSSLFLKEDELARRAREGKALRNFLAAAAAPRPKDKAGPGAPPGRRPALRDYVTAVPQLDGRADLLVTTDRLAYEELNLTFEWLLRLRSKGRPPGRHDARLLLRKALHGWKKLKSRYDVVLLDCPPVVNLCCVNALAASDYVIIPVTPSTKAVERVPSTLLRLKEIKEEVNPHLDVLGLVANRTQKAKVSDPERDVLDAKEKACHGVWGTAVSYFDTSVPQRAKVRDAEDEFPPEDDDDLMPRLLQLAAEIEGRMSPHCGPSLGPWSPAPAQSAAEVSP